MHDFLKEAQGMAEKLTAFRHDLHRHPEVGIALPRTTKKVEEVLEKAGIPYSNPIPSSILVVLKGGSPGKTLLLRADMDATMLLGAALLLNKYRENLPGIVKLLWQPGEEIFGGMKPLVEAGILQSPKVDATFDMHDDVTSPLGTVTYSDEAFTTAATNFSISIRGRGGHGGFPNTTIDPINIAVQIYQGMQAMQAREIAPADYLALSICSIQAGSSYNIIPDTARIMGTMRSYDPEVHQKALDRIRELVDANASACHAKAKLGLAVNVPAIVNDPEMARAVDSYLEDFPMALIVNNHGRISASDDFGFAGEKVPSLMLMLGCKPEGVTDNNFHNPHVVMDDRALPIGTALWCHLAVHWLQDAKKIFSHREAQEKKPPQRAASFLERQVAL